MKCIIPAVNIKAFTRAVHSLAKIGDELYVEPSANGLFLRTVNSSRSAFASFFFHLNFFSSYDFSLPDNEEENCFKCKVAMRACINAFKSVNNVEKSVEKCKLMVDLDQDRLVVNMSCKHAINKTYNLPLIECEALHAVFNKKLCNFSLLCECCVMNDALVNFQTTQDEVTLSVNSNVAVIKSYIDDEPEPTKAVQTQLTLEKEEFDKFCIPCASDITFCLKELRALLGFGEPANLPLVVQFSSPGNPIIFSVENSNILEANFVLATLSSDIGESQQAIGQNKNLSRNVTQNKRLENSACASDSERIDRSTHDFTTTNIEGNKKIKENTNVATSSTSFNFKNFPQSSFKNSLNKTAIGNNFSKENTNNSLIEAEQMTLNNSTSFPNGPQFLNNSRQSTKLYRKISEDASKLLVDLSLNTSVTNKNNENVQKNSGLRISNTKSKALENSRAKLSNNSLNDSRLEEKEYSDDLGSTQPSKKKKFYFKRCLSAIVRDPLDSTCCRQVLVMESDED